MHHQQPHILHYRCTHLLLDVSTYFTEILSKDFWMIQEQIKTLFVEACKNFLGDLSKNKISFYSLFNIHTTIHIFLSSYFTLLFAKKKLIIPTKILFKEKTHLFISRLLLFTFWFCKISFSVIFSDGITFFYQ